MLNLTLERESSYYLITLFVPVAMLVIVSWLSFFIGVKEQLLKTMIALGSLVTLVILLAIWNRDQPRVSYAKAIDVWLGTCVTFIFAALIESVIAYLLDRNECDKKPGVDLNDSSEKNVSDHFESFLCFYFEFLTILNFTQVLIVNGDTGVSKLNQKCNDFCKRTKLTKLDCISIVLFPVLFIVFNVVYFLVFCCLSA